MKLHWSPRSPFVRKVMVCVHELGIVERIDTQYTLVSQSTANEDMLRVNPIGRIPALVLDDGSVLYDSAVICEYLDSKFGPKLFPAQGEARWDALRRHALANGMLELGILWLGERSRPEQQRSPERQAACERKMRNALAAAEHDADRLRGSTPDIGDLTLGVALGYLDFRYAHLKWRDAAPKLAESYALLAARPSFVSTQPYDENAR